MCYLDKDGKMPSKDEQKKMFFGVNADIKYLADWINTFVTRNNRWRSPKYLIGESYGTTRVSGLAQELQSRQWMYLNGVVLVSPTDIGIKRNGPVKAANRLPYFAATAWHHKVLPPALQNRDLLDVSQRSRSLSLSIATYQLLPKAASLTPTINKPSQSKVAFYSGLSKQAVLDNNLDINTSYFWKELLRDKEFTVGRSRFTLPWHRQEKRRFTPRLHFYAELTSWLHSFTPAINYYLREETRLQN